jgi:hypothetical protein
MSLESTLILRFVTVSEKISQPMIHLKHFLYILHSKLGKEGKFDLVGRFFSLTLKQIEEKMGVLSFLIFYILHLKTHFVDFFYVRYPACLEIYVVSP